MRWTNQPATTTKKEKAPNDTARKDILEECEMNVLRVIYDLKLLYMNIVLGP